MLCLDLLMAGKRVCTPRYQKSHGRATRIRGNRRAGKPPPDLSAMEGPRPGGTAFLFTIAGTPDKYEFRMFAIQDTIMNIVYRHDTVRGVLFVQVTQLNTKFVINRLSLLGVTSVDRP